MSKNKRYKPETELFNTKHHRQMQRGLEKMFSSSLKGDSNTSEDNQNGGWLIFLIFVIGLIILASKASH